MHNDSIQVKGWRNVVRNFTPAWFTITMGTGSISILFYFFPYGNGTWGMKIMCLIFFFLNLLIYLSFIGLSLLRYIMFPDIWRIMIRHPVQSLYIGTFPMGGTTLLTIGVNLIYGDYNVGGRPFLYMLWVLWWIDVLMSVVCCWGSLHYMMTSQKHSLEKMTPAWLLPVVTLVVGSSTGGIFAHSLQKYSVEHALVTICFSVVMVAIGLTLSLMLLTIYLFRLIIHGLPPGGTVVSTFLPLGPTGQAAFSILSLGEFYTELLPLTTANSEFLKSTVTGEVLYIISVVIAVVLWSMATMWAAFAFLGIQNIMRSSRIPFKVTVWGLIFPNGVYANITLQIARTFDSPLLRGYGAAYCVFTLLLWIFVTYKTIAALRSADIFESPCLQEASLSQSLENGNPPLHQRSPRIFVEAEIGVGELVRVD